MFRNALALINRGLPLSGEGVRDSVPFRTSVAGSALIWIN